MVSTLAAVVLVGALSASAGGLPPRTQNGAGSAATRLEMSEILEQGPRLAPSAKASALQGKRVRLVGFMAHMEDPPRGAFYLASHPVQCDEGGGGTGDLPPDAVRVVVRSAAGDEIPFYPGPIEVSGVFVIGYEADEEGRTSFFRLVLDRPEDLAKPPAPASRS